MVKQGERVRFTTGNLGTIDPEGSIFFTDHIVNEGELGTVTSGDLPDGWVAVEPDSAPGHYVPVALDMIEDVKEEG